MRKEKVLLVEDDLEMCEELIPILEDGGFVLDVAHNGKDAIARMENGDFDLVLLDLKMPGINGYEVLKYMKKIHPAIKVIILSGSPLRSQGNSDEEQIFPQGMDYHQLVVRLADGFVSKPFEVERLMGMVKELLSLSGKE